MPRPILTDRDREALHRLAAEWRSEPAPEDRGARTRETIIGLVGDEGERLDRYAAYLLLLSLLELLSPAHLPPRAGPAVLRALESLADGEGGREYVKIMDDMRALPGAPTLPDSLFRSLPPGMGSPGAGEARAEPVSESAGEARAEPGSEDAGKARAEPGSEDAGEARAEPGSEDAGEAQVEPGSEGAGEARAEPGSEGAGEARAEPRSEGAGEVRVEPGSEGAGEARVEPESEGAGDGESRDPALRPAAVTERILREATAGEAFPAHQAAKSPGAEAAADPGGDGASAAWGAPPPGTPDPGPAGHAVANFPGVDIEALARRTMQFAGNGARDGTHHRAPGGEDPPTAGGTSGGGIVRDGLLPVGGPIFDDAQSRTPPAGKTPGDDARDRAPATPGLESVLFLESAGERFALRAADVTGILGAGVHDAARIDGRPPEFVYQGESYHLVDLARALALGDTGNARESGPARVVVLLRHGERRVALFCSGVDGREELPVHALPPMVPREALATAAVIAGDGRPLLLLDTAALAQYASG